MHHKSPTNRYDAPSPPWRCDVPGSIPNLVSHRRKTSCEVSHRQHNSEQKLRWLYAQLEWWRY